MSELHEARMQEALAEADLAATSGEVPVGAVIYWNQRLIARGNNRVLRDVDPTAHAEIVAMRAAAQMLGNYRLTGCELYVTLEPCAMCAGAMTHARLGSLVYGAPDSKAGAAGSVLTVINHPHLNHQMLIHPGVLAEQCGDVLRRFFSRAPLTPPPNFPAPHFCSDPPDWRYDRDRMQLSPLLRPLVPRLPRRKLSAFWPSTPSPTPRSISRLRLGQPTRSTATLASVPSRSLLSMGNGCSPTGQGRSFLSRRDERATSASATNIWLR